MRELTELVKAAQSGDSEAYAALMQRFQQMAYATAYRYLGDHHLAQDLVQEAALEAFVHLPQLKEPGAFPGWFRQIVFRQCTRVLRQATLQCTSLEAVRDGLLAALFYGCGYSYNEVSALLKIPLTTVKKRLHSARQKLRMQLQATLRDEIENANARSGSNDEAAEIAGIAIRIARLFKKVAYTLEREASWQTSSNLNCTHSFLPRVA